MAYIYYKGRLLPTYLMLPHGPRVLTRQPGPCGLPGILRGSMGHVTPGFLRGSMGHVAPGFLRVSLGHVAKGFLRGSLGPRGPRVLTW